MPTQNPAQQNMRYEVITQEDPVTGDMIIPLPPQLLKEMGWKEGDELDFQIDDQGKVIVKKL
jgi:bifunctional DNA-binding transcriptional regulator/antitoxin component of YhaV-PrlF toxin-antitoxin module